MRMTPAARSSNLLTVVAFIAAIGLSAGWSGAADAASAAAPGGDLRVGLEADIAGLDGGFAQDPSTDLVVGQIYEGPMTRKGDEIILWLADSVDNPDPLTYIYHVKKGVKFHDGTPMTADDWVASWEHVRNPATGAPKAYTFDNVDKIAKVDDYTVKVTLKKPDWRQSWLPATTGWYIASKKYLEAHPKDFGKPTGGANGTGPFKFVSWKSGDTIELVRNDDYWNKAAGGPYLDKITFKILPEATARVAGLQTDDLDLVLGMLPGDQLPVVAQMPDVSLTTAPSYHFDYTGLNCKRPPFDNLKVRQALAHAYDRAAVTKAAYGAYATPAAKNSPYPTYGYFYEKDKLQAAYEALPAYQFDLKEAKRLLDESGVADKLNGKVILQGPWTVWTTGALALQDSLKQLGYNLEIRKITFEELVSIANDPKQDWDIFPIAWEPDVPDLGSALQAWSHVGGGMACSGGEFDKMFSLIKQSNELSDNKARTPVLIQAQAIFADQVPAIPGDFTLYNMALNKKYTGYTLSASFYWEPWATNIHLSK
jgi:peptide/nickel transport system substrate-binding protein